MFRTYMKYSAILIGLYLAVDNATGAGTLINDLATGSAKVDSTLQGR